MKKRLLLMALGLALPAMTFGQDSDAPPPRDERAPSREMNREDGPRERMRRDAPPPGRHDEAMLDHRRDGDHRGPGRERFDGQRPMVPPFFAMLDGNHDGAVDKKELKHALKKLDKNGDGKLTPDELRPQRFEGPRGDGPERARRDRNFDAPRGERGPMDGPRPLRGPRPPENR
jgi:hypothetical protein